MLQLFALLGYVLVNVSFVFLKHTIKCYHIKYVTPRT